MKKTAAILLLTLILIITGCALSGLHSQPLMLSVGAQTPQPAGEERLGWAFPVIAKVLPPRQEGERQVPGSTKTYTTAQIDDLLNPPDWFPDEDAPRPASVMKGKGVVFACGACHLMSWNGHRESHHHASGRSGTRGQPRSALRVRCIRAARQHRQRQGPGRRR